MLNCLPEGWRTDAGPSCCALDEEEPRFCGEPALWIGASGTGWAGCFCDDCREAIGDVIPHWKPIGGK